MFEVRETFDNPVLCLNVFEFLPLVRVVEAIIVGKVSILADKSDDLSFNSEGIVANNDGRCICFSFHFVESIIIVIISDASLKSLGKFLMPI